MKTVDGNKRPEPDARDSHAPQSHLATGPTAGWKTDRSTASERRR